MIVLERNHRTPLKAQMDLPKLLCIRWAVRISNSCLGICSEPLQCWGSYSTGPVNCRSYSSAGLASCPHFRRIENSSRAEWKQDGHRSGFPWGLGSSSITKAVTCLSVQHEGDGQCINLNLCLVSQDENVFIMSLMHVAGLHLLSAETSACGNLPGKGYFIHFSGTLLRQT